MTNRQSLIQCSECGQTIETGLCDPCQIHATRLAKQRIRDLEAALATERERAVANRLAAKNHLERIKELHFLSCPVCGGDIDKAHAYDCPIGNALAALEGKD